MRKFAQYLIFVLIGVAILDVFNRICMSFAYYHLPADSELMREFKYISDSDAELLIIGASRGVYDYNAGMISDSLHVSCQIIAKEGMSVISQYISVKKAIEIGKVKTIIYDLSSSQLSDDWVENQTGTYYPFYWKNQDVMSFVEEQQGRWMKYLLLSSFVQYNSTLYDIVYFGYMKKTADKNGFVPLKYTGIPFQEDESVDTMYIIRINPTGEHYLKKIINICKENSIRLILCDSPRVHSKNQVFDIYLAELAAKNQIEFWNYSDYKPISSDMRYFVDPVHINGPAADIFTGAIIDRLRNP